MKKRLSIACALSGRASVLIMDEPGAALDLECKRDIQAYLKAALFGVALIYLVLVVILSSLVKKLERRLL